MVPDDPGGTRPAPVVLRIKLRYGDIDTMVQRFAPNVGKQGMFLPTRTMHPVGTEVKFELRLSTDQPVLVGLGRVKEARQPDPNNPRHAFGLAIELMRVTREGRDVILKMLERRRQLGLSEVAIPVPSDLESARRLDVETNPRITITPPTGVPESAPQTLTAPRRASGQIAVPKLAAGIEPLAPEAPRKKRPALGELLGLAARESKSRAESGPVAAPTTNLDDEAVDVGKALSRARALAGNDLDKELEVLLESSATPTAIDVEAASAELARQLGGVPVRRGSGRSGSARWAPPPAVSAAAAVGEAAAEVASEQAQPDAAAALDAVAAQLAAAAAPAVETAVDTPAVETPVPQVEAREHEIVAPEAAETAVEPPRDEPDVEAAAPVDEVPVDEVPAAPEPATRFATRDVLPPADDEVDDASGDELAEVAAPPTSTEHALSVDSGRDGLIHDNVDAEAFAEERERDIGDEEHEVDADQIDDEIHQLDESDFEEVENTYAGDNPYAEDDVAELEAQRRTPPPIPVEPPDPLEERLEAELRRAEEEADEDLGIATRALPAGTYNRPPEDFAATGDGEGGDLVERPSTDYLPTLDGEPNRFDAPSEDFDLDNSEAIPESEMNAHVPREDPLDGAEVDDFEILAESDAEDDEDDVPDEGDLLDPATMRPSKSDFAFRLDLPEESRELHVPRRVRDERADSELDELDGLDEPIDAPVDRDPRDRSAAAALAAFDDDSAFHRIEAEDASRKRRGPRPIYDDPSSSYTVPSELGDIDPQLDTRFAQFDESDVIALPPSARKLTPTPTPTPIGPKPRIETGPKPRPTPAPAPREDLDLESALEALDVDLDDLSIPHATTELRRDIKPPPKAPAKPPRATSDHGILIDFDDDD